jgi:hypothetical protein
MKNDLEILAKYESWFYSAVHCDYIRALWDSDMKVLVPIYEKWTGQKANMNGACSKCKLTFMKKFGVLYFKNKEKMEIENGKNTEQRSEGQSEVCSSTNSKRKQSKSGIRKSNGRV